MEGFLSIPAVKNIISASDVKNPVEALKRPFFYGIVEYDKSGRKIVKEFAVYNERAFRERFEDERFCHFCFEFDKHDFSCRDSGWH